MNKMISVVLAFSLSACSFFGPGLKGDLTVCAEQVGADLLQRVEAILLGSNVQAQIDILVAQVGVDGVICALRAAVAHFKGIQGAALARADYAQAIAAGQAQVDRLSR